jgi:hypothetical protein
LVVHLTVTNTAEIDSDDDDDRDDDLLLTDPP